MELGGQTRGMLLCLLALLVALDSGGSIRSSVHCLSGKTIDDNHQQQLDVGADQRGEQRTATPTKAGQEQVTSVEASTSSVVAPPPSTTTEQTSSQQQQKKQQQQANGGKWRRKRPQAAGASGAGSKGSGAAAACEYEKGAWEECDSKGLQRRTLRLKVRSTASPSSASKCEPIKMIQRECKVAGCKYLRGDWSAGCVDGRRTRVDRLVSRVGTGAGASSFTCQPQRRVTKDCKRTCHYIKSAWSECVNGLKTRNLTLAETESAGGSGCATEKQLVRECRAAASTDLSRSLDPKQQPATTTTTTASPSPPHPAPTIPGGRQTAAPTSASGGTKLTAAQRRRLKQAQRREQREQQKLQQQQAAAAAAVTSNNNNNNDNARTGPDASQVAGGGRSSSSGKT